MYFRFRFLCLRFSLDMILLERKNSLSVSVVLLFLFFLTTADWKTNRWVLQEQSSSNQESGSAPEWLYFQHCVEHKCNCVTFYLCLCLKLWGAVVTWPILMQFRCPVTEIQSQSYLPLWPTQTLRWEPKIHNSAVLIRFVCSSVPTSIHLQSQWHNSRLYDVYMPWCPGNLSHFPVLK